MCFYWKRHFVQRLFHLIVDSQKLGMVQRKWPTYSDRLESPLEMCRTSTTSFVLKMCQTAWLEQSWTVFCHDVMMLKEWAQVNPNLTDLKWKVYAGVHEVLSVFLTSHVLVRLESWLVHLVKVTKSSREGEDTVKDWEMKTIWSDVRLREIHVRMKMVVVSHLWCDGFAAVWVWKWR